MSRKSGLSHYKRKRNFRRTPEPADGKHQIRGGRRFVVQKHAARQLHYDFRFEIDGVLVSWACPQGIVHKSIGKTARNTNRRSSGEICEI